MHFEPGKLYHVYNQGNNRQPIFFSSENYRYFLRKMRKQLLSECNILAYCLMPNHFHWLLYVKDAHTRTHQIASSDLMSQHPLVNRIATLLRSYAQAINKQENRSGSPFRQKTKAIEIETIKYALTCMHYIHQNPVRAALVENMEDWKFSSYRDYTKLRNGSLPNQTLAFNLLSIKDNTDFIKKSGQAINKKMVDKLY